MKKYLILAVAGALLAGPALAEQSKAPKPENAPKMCEMMHQGMKMKGMMVKGADGKMQCRMMDHSQMEQGKPAQGHEHKGHAGHDPK